MKRVPSLIAAAAILATPLTIPAISYADDTNEGRRLAEMAFQGLDLQNRGYIDMSEYLHFGADVFISMDQDESDSIDLVEFMDWDYGMAIVAEDRDRFDAYETALRVVFAFWDRNGDGEITKAEHGQSLIFDYQRADNNRDGELTAEEFLSGFSVMIALRAALNPIPVD